MAPRSGLSGQPNSEGSKSRRSSKAGASLDVESGNGGGAPVEAEGQGPAPVAPTKRRQQVIVFRRLTLEVQGRRRQWQTLLQDVSGYVRPGDLLAVLGPSGSGKSTLLDILSGRKTNGRLAAGSQVLFNGQPPSSALLRRDVGYVEQQNSLLALLSPREMLLYTAELKLPRTIPRADKRRLVDALIGKLSLEDCQHTPIGSTMQRGISGGEAKRTSVGVAMISRPAVLLCDEATSGLDSWNAHSVVAALQELSHDGIAIAGTIHSPPPDTFALFNHVLILQKARVVYFGDNGEPAEQYFTSRFPDLRPMRPSEGLSDFIIDVTTTANKQGGEAAAVFAYTYAASDLAAHNEAMIEELLEASAARSSSAGHHHHMTIKVQSMRHVVAGLGGSQGTITPVWWGLYILARYRSARAYRQLDWLLPRVISPLIPVFLLSTVYWGIGDNLDATHVTSIAAVVFMWCVSCAYSSMGIMPTLVAERPVFLRERADGLYRPVTYLLYKVCEEMVVELAISAPYSAACFWIVKLQGSFALFWLVYLVSTAISRALAFFIGALASSMDVAGAALPAYTTSLLYFSGFLIPFDQISRGWKWYSVISYLRYAWGSLMANQFGGDRNIKSFGGVPVLDYYGLEHISKWGWLGWEALFAAVFLAAAWAALAGVRHQVR